MDKETYEREKRRIERDSRYSASLKQWMLKKLREMYENQRKGDTK